MSEILRKILSVAAITGLILCVNGCEGTQTWHGASQSAQMSDAGIQSLGRSPDHFNTETYDSVIENPFILAVSQPQSTFSIDVDTASYSNVRRMISEGQLPPSGAVRIEELVNYFSYTYPEPEDEHPLRVDAQYAVCPWSSDHHLLRLALKGESIPQDKRPDSNLVFLIDVSGSMMQRSKLPLVKSALKLLVSELHEKDRVAIVVYAGDSGIALPSTPATRSQEILDAIYDLKAGGSTNGSAGIQSAYRIAEENYIAHGINRVILCTDGDFNVGTTNQSELVDLITEKAKSNVFLTVLGFGDGNLKDSTMEKLSDKGNGNYAYIDSLLEARKVLVEQLGATLNTIAKDVKIQVDFNPKTVQSYRLLGYENRVLANQDFRDDRKDAGEIGSGHTVTAFYEIVPIGSTSQVPIERPSEFVAKQIVGDSSTMLTVNLRYKLPEASRASEIQLRVGVDQLQAHPSDDFQFASAVVAYGMLLKRSVFRGSASWDWVIETAAQHRGADDQALRSQFVELAKTARQLANQREDGL